MKDKLIHALLNPGIGLQLILVLALGLGLRIFLARFFLVGVDMVTSYYIPVLTLFGSQEVHFLGWDQWHVRLGSIMPLALSHWLTGRADIAIPLAALPFSMFQVLAVFLIGRLLWNDKVGILAALFEAVYPVSVMFGAKILPNTPMACSVTAAMLFFFYGHRNQRLLFFVLAGVCIGVGYTANVTALFFMVILSVLCWFQRKSLPRWSMVAVGVGALLVLIVETLILSLLNNGFHFRPWNLVDMSGRIGSELHMYPPAGRYIPGFFGGLFWPLNTGFVYHGLFGLAALSGVIIFLLKSELKDQCATVVWWWLGLLFMVNFACRDLSHPIIYTLQMRYLMFMTPAICLITAVVLVKLRHGLRLSAVAGLVASSLVCCYALYSTWKPQDEGYRHLYGLIEKRGETTYTVFFHDWFSSIYTRLVVGGERRYTLIESVDQLRQARPGDLATIIIGGYIKEEHLPEGYREQIQTEPWKKIDDWRWNPGIVYAIFQNLEIPVKKGFHRSVQVYQYLPGELSSPDDDGSRRPGNT